MIREMRKKNVIQSVDRRNPDIRGYLYKPLDRRQQGDERLFSRVLRGEFGNPYVDEDVKAYGDRTYERMHET